MYSEKRYYKAWFKGQQLKFSVNYLSSCECPMDNGGYVKFLTNLKNISKEFKINFIKAYSEYELIYNLYQFLDSYEILEISNINFMLDNE